MHFLSPAKIKFIPLLLLLVFITVSLSCSKKTAEEKSPEQEEVQEITQEADETEGLFDFYFPALDDGNWVESLLAKLEEERIAEELNSMEESLNEYQEFQNNPESSENQKEGEESSEEAEVASLSDVEKFFKEEKNGNVLYGKNDELKFYEFDDEIFVPQYSDGKLIAVHTNGTKTERLFYDEKYNLVKKENWNIPSVQGARLEKTQEYEYFPDSARLSSTSIKFTDSLEKISYSNSSKVLSSEKYQLLEKEEKPLFKRSLLYDSEDRLYSDELIEYIYKDKEYKELDYTFTKKYVYSFNKDDIPPDFKYYENGLLKMLNKYSSEKGNYVSEIFFDDNFSVKTYYEKDVRVKDVFYIGGKVSREKIYDKMD